MPEHKCVRGKEIDEIHEMCTRMDQGLRGNGKAGLFTEFAILKNTVKGLIFMNVLIITALISIWVQSL